MIQTQEIAIRLSECREKLNAAITADDTEIEQELQRDYAALEAEYRDACRAELDSVTTVDRAAAQLAAQVHVTDYLTAAAETRAINGAAAELNAAYGLGITGQSGGTLIPFEVLARALETRADVATDTSALDGPVAQSAILPKLYGSKRVLESLGVQMIRVPAGQSELVLISTGSSAAQMKEGTAHDATALAYATHTLKPKRLTGRIGYSVEQAAHVGADLEASMTRDLTSAIGSQMCTSILTGPAVTNSAPQNIPGLLTEISAPTNPTDLATFSGIAGAADQAVDGYTCRIS